MGTGATGECVYCEQTVYLADDGAWETQDGACGCTASLERGGDGEHYALGDAEEAREVVRGMLADWEAATDEQREAACKAAADAADRAGGA